MPNYSCIIVHIQLELHPSIPQTSQSLPHIAFYLLANDYSELHFNPRFYRCAQKAGDGHDACSQDEMMNYKRCVEKQEHDACFPYLYVGVYSGLHLLIQVSR